MSKGPIDRKELRTFGISLSVVVLIWAGILYWRGHMGAVPYLLGASPILLLLGLVAPIALYPLHKVWMPIAKGIAKLLTWLILTLVFYLVFTPYSIVLRILGKDPLDRKIEKDRSSYWTIRNDGAFDPKSTSRQY